MWVLECKAKYDELFDIAQKRRSEPPDVMHPDHANIVDGDLVITGPVDRRSREQWEQLKSYIKIASWLHARSRQRFKLDPTEKNQAELKDIEARRRLLMRAVPKGWNWREEIYCRYSRTK